MRPTYPRAKRRKKRDEKSSMSLYRMVACTLSLSVGPRLGFQCLAGWSVLCTGNCGFAGMGSLGHLNPSGRRRGMDLGLVDRGMTPPAVASPAAKPTASLPNLSLQPIIHAYYFGPKSLKLASPIPIPKSF